MEKNNKGIIVLLILIIIVLGALCALLATGTISFKNNEVNCTNEPSNVQEKNEITYKEIEGLYSYTYKNEENEEGICYLYLYENGTFNYRINGFISSGYIGNYIIEENNLKLNYLYSYGSGVGLMGAKGEKKLTINSNNTITDANQPIVNKEITLSKDDNMQMKKYYEEQNPTDMIYNNYKENEARLNN